MWCEFIMPENETVLMGVCCVQVIFWTWVGGNAEAEGINELNSDFETPWAIEVVNWSINSRTEVTPRFALLHTW